MNPPRWAESLLFTALSPRDRGVITGDLLEEYREDIVPCRGVFRARLWYVWQTLTLVAFLRRPVMGKSSGWMWMAGGFAWAASIAAVLVRSGFAPPALPRTAVLVPIALTLAALSALRSKSDLKDLWRTARVWAMLLVVAAGVRVLVDAIVPFDVERYILAQVRPGFSEMEFPRRFLFGSAIALILAAAGFHGAWKTSRVRSGILSSIASALIVTTPLFAFAAFVDRSSIPYQILLASSTIASVLGTVGAMLGRGMRAAPVRKSLAVPLLMLSLLGCSTGPLETAKTLAALHYDTSKTISVEGPISLIHFPPQGPGMILVKGKDRGYALLMAETKEMAKGGFNRFSVGPGVSVRITGLLPEDGRTIEGVIAVQATTVKTLDGRTLFDRSALAN